MCVPCNANTPCQNGRPCWGYSECKSNPDGGPAVLCGDPETPECSPRFRDVEAAEEFLNKFPTRMARHVIGDSAFGGAARIARDADASPISLTRGSLDRPRRGVRRPGERLLDMPWAAHGHHLSRL